MLEKINKGTTISQVSRQFGVSMTAIHRWKKLENIKEERQASKNGVVPVSNLVGIHTPIEERYLQVLERIAIALERMAGAWEQK